MFAIVVVVEEAKSVQIHGDGTYLFAHPLHSVASSSTLRRTHTVRPGLMRASVTCILLVIDDTVMKVLVGGGQAAFAAAAAFSSRVKSFGVVKLVSAAIPPR